MLLYVQFRCGSWGVFTFQVTRELQPHGAPSVDGTSKGSSLLMSPISRRVPPRRCLRARSERGPGLSLLPAGGKRREKAAGEQWGAPGAGGAPAALPPAPPPLPAGPRAAPLPRAACPEPAPLTGDPRSP